MKEGKIIKLFVVKTERHTYWVQEIPGYMGMGRDFVVMKNRRRLYAERFKKAQPAVAWLLGYLSREVNDSALFATDQDTRYLNV